MVLLFVVVCCGLLIIVVVCRCCMLVFPLCVVVAYCELFVGASVDDMCGCVLLLCW